VLDGDGRPVKSSLVEIWQANAAGGLLLTEHVTKMVAEHFGRLEAHDLVEAASRRTFVERLTDAVCYAA
jgi:adenylosuccinate lyase